MDAAEGFGGGFHADRRMTSFDVTSYSPKEEEEQKRSDMLLKRIDPDISMFTGFLLLSLVQSVFSRPKGGRRGGSIAVFGGRGDRFSLASSRWAVLSPATKVLVLIFCLILGIFLLVGLYRAYVWCTKDTGRR